MDPVLIASTTTDDDISRLRDALRGTLGFSEEDGNPTAGRDWCTDWASLAELGVVGFCVPEEQGGLGMQVRAAVATAMELGAALHGSPYAGLAASAHALAHSDAPEAEKLLRDLLVGERVCTFGRVGQEGTVARTVDGVAEADALLLVDPSSEGAVLLNHSSDWEADASRYGFDMTRTCADVSFKDGSGHRIVDRGHALELHGLLLAADAVGSLQHMLNRTTAYAGQRNAFGKPIGAFQAVQHRLVNHTVRVRGMALVLTEAAHHLAIGSPEARRYVAMAEVSVSSSATHILHDLLQLSGAIGFTWEYGLHFYERRAHQDSRLAANPRTALRVLTQIEGWTNIH